MSDVWKQRRKKSYSQERLWLWTSRNRHCAYCGIMLCLKPGRLNTLTVDHVIPLAKGGKNKRSNYSPSCAPCNQAKGNSLLSVSL